MSEEMIRYDGEESEDVLYAKYEKLLFQKAEVKKEALHWEMEYNREFGDELLLVFKEKIECIRLKKTIGYCQMFINRGEQINTDVMNEYIQTAMLEYTKRLHKLIEEVDMAKGGTEIGRSSVRKIKQIYRCLAKKIHPDICPLTMRNEELSDLWMDLTEAYETNNLDWMEEIEAMINNILEGYDLEGIDYEVPDIGGRIEKLTAEIVKITNSEPYIYSELLIDKEQVEAKHKALKKELEEYRTYNNSLQEMLDKLMGSGGGGFVWQMN